MLQNYAETGTALCAAVAATLQVAAVAIGGSIRLEMPSGGTIGPCFNLCYAVPASVRDAGAIEPVIAPLRSRIQAFQNWAAQQEPTTVHHRCLTKKSELDAAARAISPDSKLIRAIGKEYARLRVALTPKMVLSRLSVAAVKSAGPRSVDHALLYLAGGTDPSDAWNAQSPVDREELARQLNLSWEGTLRAPGGTVVPFDLNTLWITCSSNLASLYSNRELHACSRPVPMLLLTETESPPRAPIPADVGADWDAQIGKMLDVRILKERRVLRLSPAAAEEQFSYVECFRRRITGLATEHQKHLAYLPDLACRIALLFSIFRTESIEEVPLETLVAATVLAEWFGMAHGTALSSIRLGERKLTRPDSAAPPDKLPASEVMLAKITSKAPVTRRQLWDSYNKPTKESFQPVLDALLTSGKVCWLDEKRLVHADWDGKGGSAGGLPSTPKAATPFPRASSS